MSASLDNARARLSRISGVDPPAPRVSQIDAARLDEEFTSIINDEVAIVARTLPFQTRGWFLTSVCTCIHLALVAGSILRCGRTPGMAAQGLHYANAVPSATDVGTSVLKTEHGSRSATVGVVTRRRLAVLTILIVGLPAVWERIRRRALARGWAMPAAPLWQQRCWQCITQVDRVLAICRSLNMVAFLYDGQHRSLAERLAAVKVQCDEPTQPRSISFEYLNQQLVWGELQSFIVFLMPLLTPRTLAASRAASVLSFFARSLQGKTVKGMSEASKTSSAQVCCCICNRKPILCSVQTPCCKAWCCYMCMHQRWQRSLALTCPSCHQQCKEIHLVPDLLPDDGTLMFQS